MGGHAALAAALAAAMVAAAAAADATAGAAAPPKECFCGPKAFGRDCSAACCAKPGARDCPPLPSPNPPTCMTTVTVPGSVAAGAVYPDGSAAHYELNYTGSPGWVVHMSGGGWRFMKNTSAPAAQGDDSSEPAPLTPDGVLFGEALAEGGGPKPCSGCYGSCDGLMSTDASQNPLFHSFNKVFIPISGTAFTGACLWGSYRRLPPSTLALPHCRLFPCFAKPWRDSGGRLQATAPMARRTSAASASWRPCSATSRPPTAWRRPPT
jgi:hypothetical protein